MKKGLKKVKNYIKKIDYKKIKKEVKVYLKTNILTITFLITNIINGIILRYLTVKNYFNIKPILSYFTCYYIFLLFDKT